MPWRVVARYIERYVVAVLAAYIIRMLANGEVVDRLANTYVMRRLAQITHYAYRKVADAGEQKIDEVFKSENAQRLSEQNPQTGRLSSFSRTFLKNLKEEFEKANRLNP